MPKDIYRVCKPSEKPSAEGHYYANAPIEAIRLYVKDSGESPDGMQAFPVFQEDTATLDDAGKKAYFDQRKLGYKDDVSVTINADAKAAEAAAEAAAQSSGTSEGAAAQ